MDPFFLHTHLRTCSLNIAFAAQGKDQPSCHSPFNLLQKTTPKLSPPTPPAQPSSLPTALDLPLKQHTLAFRSKLFSQQLSDGSDPRPSMPLHQHTNASTPSPPWDCDISLLLDPRRREAPWPADRDTADLNDIPDPNLKGVARPPPGSAISERCGSGTAQRRRWRGAMKLAAPLSQGQQQWLIRRSQTDLIIQVTFSNPNSFKERLPNTSQINIIIPLQHDNAPKHTASVAEKSSGTNTCQVTRRRDSTSTSNHSTRNSKATFLIPSANTLPRKGLRRCRIPDEKTIFGTHPQFSRHNRCAPPSSPLP